MDDDWETAADAAQEDELEDWEKDADEEDELDKAKYEGEDEEDDWDADPSEKKKTSSRPKQPAKPKKLTAKQVERQQKKLEMKGRRMTAEEKEAEKAKKEAAILKMNEAQIDDMFGDNDFGDDDDIEDDGAAIDGFDRDKVKAQANEALFGAEEDYEDEEEEKEEDKMKDFKVDSEGDVTDFAKFVADKIKKAPGHKLVIKFLDEVLKGATENFQMNDVKIVQKNLTQIYNVKRLEFNQKKNAKKKKADTEDEAQKPC
mmetsp:Transcript_13289/g.21695  ORF Transcript_13289/g.21695 Transcript_13289/m.21695 type:complete len:258 (-) Transcript_13289:165-938(-)